jgi:transitional endoplasmic reticulum ATPase
MPGRQTRETTYVRLPESRIREIDELVASGPRDQGLHARAAAPVPAAVGFDQQPSGNPSVLFMAPRKAFEILKEPDILTDWQRRFRDFGSDQIPRKPGTRSSKRRSRPRITAICCPCWTANSPTSTSPGSWSRCSKRSTAPISARNTSRTQYPTAPLLLIVGPSGSGKTATTSQAIDR